MTWTSAMASTRKLRQGLLQLSLLSGLMLVASCEGSSLGDRVGQSLEPDPQIAENAEVVSTETSNSNSGNSSPSTDDKQSADTSTEEGAAEDADASEAAEAEPAVVAGDYTDIGKAPEEIQPYLVDLIELGLLEVRPVAAPATPAPKPADTAASTDDDSTESDSEADSDEASSESTPAPTPSQPANPPAPDEFRPNQAMTRREYARWLLAVNNKFYAGVRTRIIRPGVTSSQPVFQDVPTSDSDFAAIQGLAEAGIIPSPLTGSSTTVTFRPNAPLTRKDLLLWKVPLDTRQALPEASISAVQQAWGFQDAAKIAPRALQAVLADYQNGDFANIRRAFNYTTLFQPDKAATRAEGGAVLWRFGNPAEGITAAEIRNPNGTDPDDSEDENTPTDD